MNDVQTLWNVKMITILKYALIVARKNTMLSFTRTQATTCKTTDHRADPTKFTNGRRLMKVKGKLEQKVSRKRLFSTAVEN